MSWESWSKSLQQKRLRELEFGEEPEKDESDPWQYAPISELYKTIDILTSSGADPALLAHVKKVAKDRGGKV